MCRSSPRGNGGNNLGLDFSRDELEVESGGNWGQGGGRGGREGGVAAFHNSFLIMIIMMMTRLGLARMRHAKLLVVVAPGQDQSCECHTVSLIGAGSRRWVVV